jgi:hemolysin III
MFGVSALYHRVDWLPDARRWMRRLDHSMIFVLVAGTYTPIALLATRGVLAHVMLAVAWGAALAGVVVTLLWVDAPCWLTTAFYLALGAISVFAMPQILDRAGAVALALLVGGGLLYAAGAVVYVCKRPDPVPAVFGYHELFHALVIAAAIAHYTAIAAYLLPLSTAAAS